MATDRLRLTALPASQALALALGARSGAPETRHVGERLERDAAWRKVVLERALRERGLDGGGSAAVETRRGL